MKKLEARKKPYQQSIRTNITLTPILFEASKELVRKGGYNGLSDWIQSRIRRDAKLDADESAAA